MRKLVALTVLALALTGISTAQAANKLAATKSNIDNYVVATQHMQRVMGIPVTKSNYTYRTAKSIKYVLWVQKYWKRTNWNVRQKFNNPPHKAALLCIHRYEGSWSDDNAPFWGGLQMDLSFQASYGSYLFKHKGTANRWTPLEQMWVAERAIVSRGFYPWPNTAKYCGLI